MSRIYAVVLALALLAAPTSAQLSVPKTYPLAFSSIALAAPVDTTTYYVGQLFGFAPTTTAAIQPIWIGRAGTIRKIYLTVLNLGVAGTAETSTVSLRLNNTTDTTITSAFVTNAAASSFSNTALAIAVADNAFVEIKWVTPAWVTNPTNVIINGVIYIDVP